MANEETQFDNTGEEQEIDLDFEIDEEETEVEEEKPVAKPTESLEARKARLERQLAQTYKKMGLSNDKKEVKSQTNDLGESAFLIANGLKDTEERQFAKKLAKETGKDLESLLETTYFQSELKALREAKITDNANIKGGKRGNNSSIDTVEYWIAKGELPPASEVDLRRQVVNARINKGTSTGVFYNS